MTLPPPPDLVRSDVIVENAPSFLVQCEPGRGMWATRVRGAPGQPGGPIVVYGARDDLEAAFPGYLFEPTTIVSAAGAGQRARLAQLAAELQRQAGAEHAAAERCEELRAQIARLSAAYPYPEAAAAPALLGKRPQPEPAAALLPPPPPPLLATPPATPPPAKPDAQ